MEAQVAYHCRRGAAVSNPRAFTPAPLLRKLCGGYAMRKFRTVASGASATLAGLAAESVGTSQAAASGRFASIRTPERDRQIATAPDPCGSGASRVMLLLSL